MRATLTKYFDKCHRSTLYLLILIGGGGLFLLYRSCLMKQDEARPYSMLSGEIFHTFYQIKYDLPEDLSGTVNDTFKAFNQSLNPFDSTSLITAINRNKTVETDSMIRHVWRAAYSISEASEGSYDVTCSPYISAWGFGFDSLKQVTPRLLDSIRPFVGYQRVRLEETKLIKNDPRTSINFSSISKGYCSDLVATALASKGARNYMVELGGEIAFRGRNPEGKPWRIGINKPIEDTSGVIADVQVIISLDRPEGGLATSGNYRNFKVVDGRKVAHTINPLTGYPIQTDVLSATILAPNCMLADGLATACMTMPSSRVPRLIQKFKGVEYLLILADEGRGGFRTEMSEGMKQLIVEPH